MNARYDFPERQLTDTDLINVRLWLTLWRLWFSYSIFNRFNLKEMKAIQNNIVLLRITESVQSVLPQLQCTC
jgi:hypothetical protein